MLKEFLEIYLKKEINDEPRNYIGASSIGKPCLRQIWYEYNGIKKNKLEPTKQITFQIGKELEKMILDYLKKSGIIIVCQGKFYSDATVLSLQGHVDGIIILNNEEKAILEIKTAKESSFNRFVKHGLKEWSEQYYCQLQTYMGMSKINRGVLLAINKNSSEIHEEWIDFDPEIYEKIKLKALKISNSAEPLEKLCTNGSYYICKMCEFREICHV
jgi:hypothetical protein